MSSFNPARLLTFAFVLASPLDALAQPAAPANAAAPAGRGQSRGGGGGGAGAVVSPEVAADRHVTFRIFAPKATEVSVMGQWDDNKRHPMTKDERGVWSITVGPLEPSYWFYNFTLDGIDIADPTIRRASLPRAPPSTLSPGPAPRKPDSWGRSPTWPH